MDFFAFSIVQTLILMKFSLCIFFLLLLVLPVLYPRDHGPLILSNSSPNLCSFLSVGGLPFHLGAREHSLNFRKSRLSSDCSAWPEPGFTDGAVGTVEVRAECPTALPCRLLPPPTLALSAVLIARAPVPGLVFFFSTKEFLLLMTV